MIRITTVLLLLFFTPVIQAQSFEEAFVDAINEVRNRGCRCSGERFKPVASVKYHDLLSLSAARHAQDIRNQRRLNHYSRNGRNIGERIQHVGYRWRVVGENLAYGQRSISEVISDWLDSYTHCKLLMDPRFEDVGFAKNGPYWVLHFGKTK